jgi:hypothetical protein
VLDGVHMLIHFFLEDICYFVSKGYVINFFYIASNGFLKGILVFDTFQGGFGGFTHPFSSKKGIDRLRHWGEFSYIFPFCNINNNHYMALLLDKVNRICFVVDSLTRSSTTYEEAIRRGLDLGLPVFKLESSIKFDIQYLHLFKQNNNNDCGPYTLLNIIVILKYLTS